MASSVASRLAAWSAIIISITARRTSNSWAEMSKIAAAAHCPFIAGASPTAFQMDSWQELANPRDLTKIFQTPEYAGWRSLRESDDARYIGLALPRFLGRTPYGAKTNPVDAFDFEEDVEGAAARPLLLVQRRLRDGA